jgi:coenzyme F420-reducing hydrogenase beta subunit
MPWAESPTAVMVPVSPREISRSGLCIGCGSCVAQAHRSGTTTAAMDFDRFGLLQPMGDREWHRNPTDQFARTCPFSPAATNEDVLAGELYPSTTSRHTATGRFDAAYVGHVAENGFRTEGSSGGMASWLLAELFRTGVIDGAAHVVPRSRNGSEEHFFRYRIARSVEDIRAGAKSRYYPVEMSAVLDEMRAVPGRYAVVGIPCFIKAVQLLRRDDPLMRDRIVATVGLFCGHMKSARFVESLAWQLGCEVGDVAAVEFRRKDISRPANTYTAELRLFDGSVLVRDWWNLTDGDWGSGFFQSPACNACDDVVAETADVSVGDAWVEPYESDGRGTNVVIVRSGVIGELVRRGIDDGRLVLEPVDGSFVEATQAAGLRQRREGLAYRLTWTRRGVHPRKRVEPSRRLPIRRKLIYRSRSLISSWSHRVFWLARRLRCPQLYFHWSTAAKVSYHALTYSRGRLGAVVDRLMPPP